MTSNQWKGNVSLLAIQPFTINWSTCNSIHVNSASFREVTCLLITVLMSSTLIVSSIPSNYEVVERAHVCTFWPEFVVNITCYLERLNHTAYNSSTEVIIKPGIKPSASFERGCVNGSGHYHFRLSIINLSSRYVIGETRRWGNQRQENIKLSWIHQQKLAIRIRNATNFIVE